LQHHPHDDILFFVAKLRRDRAQQQPSIKDASVHRRW
jgi:hypothetical protein